MTIAIMQPYFLPYIGYFQLLNTVDRFVLYDDVNFINRGWVNRNNILLGGKAHLFTIPLINASQNKLIFEVEVSPELAWRTKLLKTLKQAYQKAPYFQDVFPIIENILEITANDISDLCFQAICLISSYLNINTTIVRTSRGYDNIALKGQERIISICKAEGADCYINPIGGTDLYDKERFKKEGIDMHFLKSKSHSYTQFKNAFVPWLSIVDVIMFNSIEQTKNLLLEFELV